MGRIVNTLRKLHPDFFIGMSAGAMLTVVASSGISLFWSASDVVGKSDGQQQPASSGSDASKIWQDGVGNFRLGDSKGNADRQGRPAAECGDSSRDDCAEKSFPSFAVFKCQCRDRAENRNGDSGRSDNPLHTIPHAGLDNRMVTEAGGKSIAPGEGL